MSDERADIPIEDTEEDEEIYVDYDITTYPSDNTLLVLTSMWPNDIEIPDFQRGFVWNIKQSSLLVESFLRGLPVPPIFFFIDDDHKNLVVDGQQRLLSIIYFYEGYFGAPDRNSRRRVFKLTGLNEKSRYSGKTYRDLTDSERRKLDTSVLRSINIRQLNPASDASSVFHIFERLNTGGTPLRAQEIRNTVYRGKIVELLRSANLDPNWRKIIGRPEPDRHERDVEIVLRLMALYVTGDNYETPMKKFLNTAMKNNRKGQGERTRRFFRHFPDVTRYIVENMGEKPFSPRGPLSVAILDAVFTALMTKWPRLVDNPKGKLKELLNDKQFVDYSSSRTADTEILKKRLGLARGKFA